jgi:hypothetical protein
MICLGESPSSSASDVDNLNSQAPVDKSNLSKGTGSHVAGSQVNLARNRPNFVRLLDFVSSFNLRNLFIVSSRVIFMAFVIISSGVLISCCNIL